METFHALDDLAATVLEAAAAGPVLVVLEDMHWADRSTQDFAAVMSRTARGRLLFVLTFRSDELHRRHPFRRTLAEISRTFAARRIDLDALGHDDIAGIVAASRDGPPDPSVVGSVLARSEGNPLYAEELLAADQEGIPGHLSDLLLARIDALDEGPRALLRVASIDGTRLDTGTLADLAGLDQPQLDGYLREALDANVLRQIGDSLEFRHGLLREATYDDLLPAERSRTHGRMAEILQANVDSEPDPALSTLSRLAFHWDAAHDLPRTLAASVRAGVVAQRLGLAEALTQLERALSLWDRVPDAEAVAGRPQAEIVVLLGESAGDQGDNERWHTLVRSAVDMVGPDTDPLLASRVYSALAACSFHTEDTIGAEEAIRRAVEYAGDSPTEELARALGAQAEFFNRHDHFGESVVAAERAADAARIAGCVEPRVDAVMVRALSLGYLGHIGEALAGLEQAIVLAREAGLVGEALDTTMYLAVQYMEAGQLDRGLSLASEGFDEGRALGLPMQGVMCGDAMLMGLLWQGRLGEAEQRLEEIGELGVPTSRWHCPDAELLLARGDARGAAPLVREAAAETQKASRQPEDTDVLTELELAAMLDDPQQALEKAGSFLSKLDECDSPLVAAAAARIGFQALCFGRSTPWAQADELRDLAAGQLALARDGLTDAWRSTYHGVQLALAEAYATRLAGEPAVAQFREATELAEPFGAYFALEPRLNLAEELLAHSGRDEGRELLVDCWSTAHDMGAHDVERRAARLATRTRVPLPGAAVGRGPLSRLTPREREVLDLLATGATNRAIATSLFITEKTASVHVSNLIAKLGVANRGEAAALARDHAG